MSGLIARGRAYLDENGLARTFWKGLDWLVTRPKLLIYEPVETLRETDPVPAFDQQARGPRIAVQIHAFYPELLDELIDHINRIPYRFDCYISTDTEAKANHVRQSVAGRCRAENTHIAVFPNRGRDVAPLLLQLAPVIDRYDYILHLHTKGSSHRDFGGGWRSHLLKSLLASPGYVAAILQRFEADEHLGLAIQRTYWRVKPSLGWKGNRKGSKELLTRRLGLKASLPMYPQFPAGDMFWARTAAVALMFQAGLTMNDFPAEARQLDGTLAHCIERCWGCVAEARGYGICRLTSDDRTIRAYDAARSLERREAV